MTKRSLLGEPFQVLRRKWLEIKEDGMIDQLEFILFLLGESIQAKPITFKSYVYLICAPFYFHFSKPWYDGSTEIYFSSNGATLLGMIYLFHSA